MDDSSFLSLQEMNKAARLWEQARAEVADDSLLLARVRRDRLPFDQAWIQNWARLKREAERKDFEFLGPNDINAACDEYLKTVTEFTGPDYIAECAAGGAENCIKRIGIEPGVTGREQLDRYNQDSAALPDELRGLSEDQYHIFQMDKKLLYNGAEMVDDPAATDGKAVCLAGNWSMVQLNVKAHFTGRWRVYARVRCEVKGGPQAGKAAGGYLSSQQAFQIGILDNFLYPFGEYVLADKRPTLDQVEDGAYYTYDVGVHDLNTGMQVWVTIADAKGVKAAYVDQVFLLLAEN